MDVRLFEFRAYVRPGEAFHFARKALDPGPPRFLHRHDYFELFLVEEGCMQHHRPRGVERLEAGALVFVRPDDAHALRAVRTRGCRILNVMLERRTAAHLGDRYRAEFGGRFFWRRGPEPERIALDRERKREIEAMADALQAGPRGQASIDAFLLGVMTRLGGGGEPGLAPAMPPWLMRACLAADDPALLRKGAAGFVEAAGRGHEHVCRMAKKHLGQSPSAFVNQKRMEVAATLLESGDLPVSAIAEACGVANLSHFHKLFRARHGATPLQYRRRQAGDPLQAGAR